jgi:hypothetical protein
VAYSDDADFFRVHAEHQLELLDRQCTTIRTRHRLTLRAQRTSRFYQRAYIWTGSGIEKDPEILSGRDELGHATHRLHGPIIRSGTQRIFIIDLGREYHNGESVVVEFKHTLLDLENRMEPFLGQDATAGCESLTLTVLIPTSFKATAWQRQSHTSTPDIATYQKAVAPQVHPSKFAETDSFSWAIGSPEVGFNYRIIWKV